LATQRLAKAPETARPFVAGPEKLLRYWPTDRRTSVDRGHKLDRHSRDARVGGRVRGLAEQPHAVAEDSTVIAPFTAASTTGLAIRARFAMTRRSLSTRVAAAGR